MARLLSVNVGLPRDIAWQGRTVHTGICLLIRASASNARPWLASFTITTDTITETNEYRSGAGAHWPFLSDPRRIVQKDLDIAEYTDQGRKEHFYPYGKAYVETLGEQD